MRSRQSKTRHFLWHASLGPNPRIPLSVEEYRAIEDAWDAILSLLPFEEEFDAVLQNYLEIESAFLGTAMQAMVLGHNDLVELRKIRLTFARRLSNLLSSCRSYLDHSPHHLKDLAQQYADTFCLLTNEAYDSEFAYRFMEALRNYAQHRGSPLHGTSFDSRRVERESEKALLQYSVGATIQTEKLRKDRKFKRSVAAELVGWDRIDVIAMCRIYIEKIAEIHGKMRQELQAAVDNAKGLLRQAIERYDKETDLGRVGIAIARSQNDRTVDDYRGIPEDVIDLYESLVRQNRRLVNLRNRFVSSELLRDRKGKTRRQ